MAKIFISYSQKDKRVVQQYVRFLEKYEQQILMDETVLKVGDDMQKNLMEAQREADGTVVFITQNSTESPHVNSEIGLARSYKDKDGKFLIPLIKGEVNVPYIIKDLNYIQIDNKTVEDVVRNILSVIERTRPQKKETRVREEITSEENIENKQSGKTYSRSDVLEIQTALRTLNFFNSQIDGIAGPATTKAIENFQSLYRIPVTGEWNEQTQKKADEIIGSRETKKESPIEGIKQEPENKPESRYWLLKVHGDNWRLENLKEGDDCYFNSYFNSDQPRTEYEDFKLIKTGDQGLAYDYSSKKSIVFSFEVTKPLHDNPRQGEIFSFRITRFFNPSLPLNDFISSIQIASELPGDSLKKLFTVAKTEYEQIIQLVGNKILEDEEDIDLIKTSISLINSDTVEYIKDELGFKSDINALASVIAYKEVRPPLAIGLFGNWGSGKSFFMNKLQKRIDYLSRKGGEDFCKKILPITFNSWHYSDSNLWASLITTIFEELETFGKKDKKNNVAQLFQSLKSTQELLDETKNEKAKVDNQIQKLEKEKEVFKTDAKKQSDELQSLSATEIIAGVMKEESIGDKIGTLKAKYPFLKFKDDEIDSIKQNIAALNDGTDKFLKSLRIIYSFRKGKIWIVILCFLAITFGVYFLITNSEILKKFSESAKIFIGVIAAFVSKVFLFLKPAREKVNKAYAELQTINTTVDNLKAKAMSKFSKKQEELQQKLDTAKDEGNRLQKEINLLSIQQQQLQNEIDDIITGKKIIRFIESRVSDERYINSLGIISWIRKDFKELDELLKQQENAQKNDTGENERPKIEFDLDRIVLYIDDLDRCDETIVVKVLEAIHLLLAFPLFVVVVGVDPRWMHNALNKKYADFLTDPGEQKTNSKVMRTNSEAASIKNNNNGTLHPLLLQAATSFDYLEKIFQIPFVLKPIDPAGKSNLIKSQFAIKNNQQEEKDKTSIHVEKDISISGPTPAPAQPAKNTSETGTENSETKTLVMTQEEKTNLQPSPNPNPSPTPQKKKEQAENKDEDEEEENASIETERLKISEEEIEFMQNISFLIGESPRTIKRYINIYRIIRTHSMFEFVDTDKQEHYKAAMIMLALITGYPDEARAIISSIETSNKAWTVNDFVNDYLTKNPSSAALKKLDHEIKSGKKIHKSGDIKIGKFQKNLVLIRRFSFRNLN